MSDIKPTRQVITADANYWLQQETGRHAAIITSLPDMEEVGLDFDRWKMWVAHCCLNLRKALDYGGIIIFYQTDRKHKGVIIDKKSLISANFTNGQQFNLIFSKIVLKQEPNTTNLFRPTFTNMFGFSRSAGPGKATPDVIHAGEMIYKNAMGYNACRAACEFIRSKDITTTILDPFCGQGSVLKIANDLGFNSIGVDIDQKQTEIAQKI